MAFSHPCGKLNKEAQHEHPRAITAGATPEPIPAPTGIVVGIDGSEQSNCALIWAAREAKLRNLPLHLVTAYTVPIFAASGLDGGYATVDDDVIRQGAEAVLREAAAKVAHLEVAHGCPG